MYENVSDRRPMSSAEARRGIEFVGEHWSKKDQAELLTLPANERAALLMLAGELGAVPVVEAPPSHDSPRAPTSQHTPAPAEQLEFSLLGGRAAAEEGMELASQADRVQEWKAAAAEWFAGLVPGQEVTADDLVAAIGLPDEGPGRNNVVGALFSGQAKIGRIRFGGRLRPSERVARHANYQRVWIVEPE